MVGEFNEIRFAVELAGEYIVSDLYN